MFDEGNDFEVVSVEIDMFLCIVDLFDLFLIELVIDVGELSVDVNFGFCVEDNWDDEVCG